MRNETYFLDPREKVTKVLKYLERKKMFHLEIHHGDYRKRKSWVAEEDQPSCYHEPMES